MGNHIIVRVGQCGGQSEIERCRVLFFSPLPNMAQCMHAEWAEGAVQLIYTVPPVLLVVQLSIGTAYEWG